MGVVELRGVLGQRRLQHQHVDDLRVYGDGRPLVVAVVDLCVAGLLHCRVLCVPDWPHWRRVPHWLPRRQPGVVWHLGQSVAGL